MKTILVVDDSAITIEIIKRIIENKFPETFTVVSANNSKQAIEILDNQLVDLLFQDLHLENQNDGIIIADYAQLNGVPICMVTAESDIELLQNIIKKKFNRLLFKPITATGIAHTIDELLHNY